MIENEINSMSNLDSTQILVVDDDEITTQQITIH